MSDSAPKMRRRRALRRQDVRSLLEEASKYLTDLSPIRVEEAETEDGTKIYLLDDEILFFQSEGGLYPTLMCRCINSMPTVVVDMGAIPFICKGADVMAPGITEIQTPFEEGEVVVVRDVKHGKALAVGKALRSSSAIMAEKKGKVIKNLHYVGDKIWAAKP